MIEKPVEGNHHVRQPPPAVPARPGALGPRPSGRGPGRDAGASALEWAVIAAIVVVAATLIGGAVYKIVQTKSEELTKCSQTTVGGVC